MTRTPSVCRDERGVTLILIALSTTALMAVAGLAIDGGRAYGVHRQVQNAADSAALAGAQQLYDYTFNSVDANLIDGSVLNQAVTTKLIQNQASETKCVLIDVSGNPLKADGTATTFNAAPACNTFSGIKGSGVASLPPSDAAGVEVAGTSTQATALMRVVGITKFTANSTVAATMQPIGGGINSPYIVCGTSTALAPNTPWPILDPNNPGSFLPIGPPSSPPYLDQTYHVIQEGNSNGRSAVDKFNDCATNSDFKGKATQPQDIVVGQTATWDNGNAAATINPPNYNVAGDTILCGTGSPALTDQCDMVLPIADTTTAASGTLYIRAFGLFHIWTSGNPNCPNQGSTRACGKILTNVNGNPIVITGGQTTATMCSSSFQPCVIKLLN